MYRKTHGCSVHVFSACHAQPVLHTLSRTACHAQFGHYVGPCHSCALGTAATGYSWYNKSVLLAVTSPTCPALALNVLDRLQATYGEAMLHSWGWTRRQDGEVGAGTCVSWAMAYTSCGCCSTSHSCGLSASADLLITSITFLISWEAGCWDWPLQ